MEVSREGWGESEGEERNSPILLAIQSENVGLEDAQCEQVGAGGLCYEGVFASPGGGVLEGPREGGVPIASSWRGGFIPYFP